MANDSSNSVAIVAIVIIVVIAIGAFYYFGMKKPETTATPSVNVTVPDTSGSKS